MTCCVRSRRVAFRTDASLEIGTGHVMRCLTLAEVLRENDVECFFLCRTHEGHLLDLIIKQGHSVIALPSVPLFANSAEEGEPAHANWLGAEWVDDTQQSLHALAENPGGPAADWLVVDHYALDARWEQVMRPACRRLMVIDDLADRPHDCDLLLDQSLGRTQEAYAGLLPEAAITLIGPSYALLRPDFSHLRSESLERRTVPRLERLLVTMGGVDKDNVTTRVLEALNQAALPENVTITVIMGPHAPWLDEVSRQSAAMRWHTEVLVGVADMARQMAGSDFAIGAGGTTTWERCSLGLPSITVVLAKNQIAIAQTLDEVGAAIAVYNPTDFKSAFDTLLADDNISAKLSRMSQAAARVADGNGAIKVAERLVGIDL